jgi:hypothetical protein
MSKKKELSERKRKQHIREMKEQLARHTGDSEFLYLGGLKSLKAQEEFLEHILFMEGVGERPLFDQLENGGVQLPHPENLEEPQIHAKLWEVIHAMALLGHYLSNTDHLSDRQLYETLWNDILREPTSICPPNSNASCHIDILGGCSEEDLQLRLKYYADEYERMDWAEEFPETPLPPQEALPYDRDRHLPALDHISSRSQEIS